MTIASSSASFVEQLGQLLIHGFFDPPPSPSSFDFNKFSRQCGVYYYLMKDNPEREFPKILEYRFDEMLANIMLRGTMVIALPFLEQTSNIVTDTGTGTDANPHFARILQNTTNFRSMLAFPKESEVDETSSTLKHEASMPRSSSSSWYNGWTPSSSGPPSTVPTPELTFPAGDALQRGDSVLTGIDSSSSIQKSRVSFRPARSGTGMRIEHPGAEVLWQHLTDSVRAGFALPSDSCYTTVVQCLCDVMLAEHMPVELLKILPDDSEALLRQQILDEWKSKEEEDASDPSDCEDYTMATATLRSEVPKLCAGLHWYIADIVLRRTIERSGGVLSMVLQDQTHIEEIVYVWMDVAISAMILVADTDDERLEFQSISESTRRHIIALGLLGSCRKSLSALKSYDRLIVCLDFLLDHNNHTSGPDNETFVPKNWIDRALEALANGVSRYAVYMRGISQQAAINRQRNGDAEDQW